MLNKNLRLWLAAGLGASSLLVACGDDGEESSVDAATAQLALAELTGAVDTSVDGYDGSDHGAAVKVQCVAGGAADVTGHVDVGLDPVSVDVQVAIGYDACKTARGTTIDGDIDFAQKVLAGAADPLRVETTYSGDIAFSGKVEAECDVDLSVVVDAEGRSVEVTGRFCGRDASELDLEIRPHWRD